jgi:baculoviral IAP repeat-containing protein 7/8
VQVELEDKAQCVVCMEIERTALLLPCGHAVVCAGCAAGLRGCPVCRTEVERGRCCSFCNV